MTRRDLPDGRVPVLLSAHADDLVRADAEAVLRYLTRTEATPRDVSAMLLRTRRIRRHRAVVRAADRTELLAGLRAVAAGHEHPLVCVSERSDSVQARKTAFVFPGQGNQWPGMGAELLAGAPSYRAEAERCDDAFARAASVSPLTYLGDVGLTTADQVLVQSAQFTHAAALAAAWRSWGVLPDITVGHSLGEVAAGYVAGVMSLPAAASVVIARARVVDALPGSFGMAALGTDIDTVTALIADISGWLELSVVNGPESVVISGELAAIREAVHRLTERGVFARELAVSYPAHTSALAPLQRQMTELLPRAGFDEAPIEFIGSVWGAPVLADTDFRQYWYQNLRSTVRFDLAVSAAVERGARTFVEMSAHPTLLVPLGDIGGDALVLGSTVRDAPVLEHLSTNIATAAVADSGYRWADLVRPTAVPRLHRFPHSPMHATYLWAESDPLPPEPPRGPIVAAERWIPIQEPSAPAARTAAVVVIDDASDDLAGWLRTALHDHPSTTLTDVDDAELLVLLAPRMDERDIRAAAAEFARRAPAQAVVRPGAAAQRVWLVTVGAEHVDADDPHPRPASAALASLHRSLGFEYPDHTFAHLDLADRNPDPRAVDAMLLDETEVALRRGDLHVRRLIREAETCTAVALDDVVLDDVVITGGTGAVGMAYARYCAARGARNIVLLSRSGANGRLADEITELAARTGTRIAAPPCDLMDPDALCRVAADHGIGPASLVVHAAAIAEIADSHQITPSAAQRVVAAKVIGLANLVENWPLRADSKLLLCSSVVGFWGGRGHGLYAAANRMLDAMAARLRAHGHGCSSVRWGLWQTAAVVTGTERDRIGRTGLVPMAPDAAVAASLTATQTDPAILQADWDRLRVFFDSQGVPMPFDDVARVDDDEACVLPERPLADIVAGALASVLRIANPDDVDLGTALVDLGVDSLLALDLRKRLRRATGRHVPLAALLAGITGVDLVATLGGTTTERVDTNHD